MNKYLLIGKSLGRFKRAYFHIVKRFCSEHENLTFIEGSLVNRLESFQHLYKKLIICCQVPSNYKFSTNPIDLRNINHLIYLHPNLNGVLYNSATNGFYSFLDNKLFKNYIPWFTDFPLIHPIKRDKPCIGFYCRFGHFLAVAMFKNLLENLKTKVDVYIMGSDGHNFSKYPMVDKCEHTLNNKKFFSNITHYVYPEDKYHYDPFPHSLLEAVQTGKQIIIPDGERDFRDGITDMQDLILFHRDFDPEVYYDNSNCPLTSENFRKFYTKLFDNNFQYSFDRMKYKTMRDWVANEIM
jgi:hypothetical protein